VATARCKTMFGHLTEFMRYFKKRYFLSPPLTEADFVSLGLRPHDKHPTPSGVPLRGAKTRWVFIPLRIPPRFLPGISGGQSEHPLTAAVLPLRARNAAVRGCSDCHGRCRIGER
jgi:hypothetical protein